jgi:DNA-binding winged helix-turn-helix (wHTH) protein
MEGPLELRGSMERAVLACLLADIGRSVSPDEIVDAVWESIHPRRPSDLAAVTPGSAS